MHCISMTCFLLVSLDQVTIYYKAIILFTVFLISMHSVLLVENVALY